MIPGDTDRIARTDARLPATCVWFTGLSGSGKSTTARLLRDRLRGLGYDVVLIDGDELRNGVSRDLGFSRTDRDANVTRASVLAREAVEKGVFSICALISPYRQARTLARQVVGAERFVEIYIATPLAVCEMRDPKGLYARARRGELHGFTGIDDPYEPPTSPDLTLTTDRTVQENVECVLRLLGSRQR